MDSDTVLANRRDCLREVVNLDRQMRGDDLISLEQVHLAVAELKPRPWRNRTVGSLDRNEAKHVAVEGMRYVCITDRDSDVMNPR